MKLQIKIHVSKCVLNKFFRYFGKANLFIRFIRQQTKTENKKTGVELFAGVGEFPSQDYSVAQTLSNRKGIEVKWECFRCLCN